MLNINAGVVVATKFVTASNKVFSSYVDYIDRDEATRNDNAGKYMDSRLISEAARFNEYIQYMDNPEKTTSLFTGDKNSLSADDKKTLKSVFQQAQTNNSLMWQTVISFDNRWLEENGLYDRESHTVDEAKMQEITRGCMGRILGKEALDNAVWSAAIHYNTDNVHIHIATVEPVPTRKTIETGPYAGQVKGTFKQSSIDIGKSFVVNNILSQQVENQRINDIIRKDIIESVRDSPLRKDQELCRLFLAIYEQLPEDRRLWKYNMNALAAVRPKIDELSKQYIEKYHKGEFADLHAMLKVQDSRYRTAYGGAKRQSYSAGKIKDMYTRMGNAVLREMRDYDRVLKQPVSNRRQSIAMRNAKSRGYSGRNNARFGRTLLLLERCIRKLGQAFDNELEHAKNQAEYERMGQERTDEG